MDDISIDNPLSCAVLEMIETYCTLDAPFAHSYSQDLLFDDANRPIHVLGKVFDTTDGIEKVKEYVRSRLWFTYRRNFAPIGGTGPETDQGWGCMLRCAQMLLGETLLRRHLGKHYIWNQTTPEGDYEKILRMFLDEKTALYSIHQIAQMGVSEGKAVGEWLGPNTAAQVMKKLAVFDTWSDIAVHVALDNILISQDVITMATMQPTLDAVKIISADGCVDESHLNSFTIVNDDDVGDGSFAVVKTWRPLLLIVPLRLGLTTINKCYLPAIQEFFKLDSCVGIIGGRPNHALYFIGISGDKLIYLDPHYCRPSLSENAGMKRNDSFMDMEKMEAVLEARDGDDGGVLDDSTYHCEMLLNMQYDQVDPSLALAFYCESEAAFDKLSADLKEHVFPASSPPLFEQLAVRPKYWPPFEPYTGVKARIEMKEFDDMCDPGCVIDDDFEVLDDTLPDQCVEEGEEVREEDDIKEMDGESLVSSDSSLLAPETCQQSK